MKEFIVFMAILKGSDNFENITYEHNFSDWETCKVFQEMVHSKYKQEYKNVTTDCFIVVNNTMSIHSTKEN